MERGGAASALSSLRRWGFAVKPASFPKLLVPMAFGSSLGALTSGSLRPLSVVVVAVFTLADAAFIVLMNDWADRRVDAIKRQMFPNAGSPKTIPDGILSPRQVLVGAMVALVLSLTACVFGVRALHRPDLVVAGAGCLFLFVLYSLPPVSLNYRGGGELLEAVGVGGALPWLALYAHSGEWLASGVELLPGSVALSLSSAVASGLSDEQSDRAGGKVTFVTVLGNARARKLSEASLLAGALLWVAVMDFRAPSRAVAIAGGVGAVLFWTWRAASISDLARTNCFDEHRRYKAALHRAVWCGMLVMAGSNVVFG